MDENVTCEKKEGGVVLTFHMAGTNGEACMAELRLSSPAVPETPETPEGPESQGKVTLLNEKHGIQLTGEGLTSDMQLSVKALDKKHADVKLMEKELSSKEQLSNPIEIQLLKDGKEIALPHKAELQLPVGERYNGKEVAVLSCDNPKVQKFQVKVKDGRALIEVETLNSFGVVFDKAFSASADNIKPDKIKPNKVKTGDETPFAVWSAMFIAGGTLFIVFKRKISETKE